MTDMRAILPGFVALLGACLAWPAPARGEARDLYPTTPDEVIRRSAASQPGPLWQVPLGPALVEDMVLLDEGRLLVSLRKDFPGLPNLDCLLVDTKTGKVLWRLARERTKGEYDRLLVLDDLLLFRVQQRSEATLLGVDPRTGAERWRTALSPAAVVVPHPEAACVLAASPRDGAVDLSALALADGAERWRRTFAVTKGESRPAPVPDGEDVLVGYDHLRRLSALDGSERYARPEVVLGDVSPPPVSADGLVWTVDASSRLVAVDSAGGAPRRSVPLAEGARYNQIYPLGGTLYLRGLSAVTAHFVSAVDPVAGRIRWTHTMAEPSVSNLVEEGGTLWLGTAGSLVALATADGRPRWTVQVTTTGRAFPVRIRKLGDRIVYIGELVVAAYDAANGRLLWRHGLTPGAEELHLNGLDAAAPNLKDEMRRGGVADRAGHRLANGMIGFAASEALRYQGLASSYRAAQSSARSRGDAISYSKAGLQRRFAEHEARMQEWTALALGVTHLALSIREMMQAAALRTFADRQVLFRKSVLAAHAQAESDAFVHRPHLVSRDIAQTFHTLAIVDLASGKRADTVLSPRYLSYGLWQVVDFERAVAYHVHIGMDPARYELGEARAYYPYSKARTLGTFLIAQPVALPK